MHLRLESFQTPWLKQAIITSIEKKGKDKRKIKSWHPISLINVNAKIVSKTLAKRLEKVLPEINQCTRIETRLLKEDPYLLQSEQNSNF